MLGKTLTKSSFLGNPSTYSRFNLSFSESDVRIFIKEYRERILEGLKQDGNNKSLFKSFANVKSVTDLKWIDDNYDMYIKDTENAPLVKNHYLSEHGFICCMIFTPDGENVICGHSTGCIQMRHGSTGTVLCTLRCIQFPPKPVYALEYSNFEERVCYASCTDGIIYRIDIPLINASIEHPPAYCIRADPALECLNTQFYGTPGVSSYSSPFMNVRSPPLAFGLTADGGQMPVGFADTSIRIFDMETQTQLIQYKVHKLRIQFIPKKLQRMHFGQVCALKCHPDRPHVFASGAWDKTLRVWDIRCKTGCMMTFEGVNICSDSIDLNRNHCIAGSWQTTEGLSLWDIAAKKRICIVRVQNRRPDIDGEYVHACKYWHSDQFNRKGKYAIIGGSGTKCVEVINLHNRYIACSYPAAGTVLAVASYQERIAFGGTDTTFNIVNFYDPKHEKEKYTPEVEPDFDYAHAVGVFGDTDDELEAM